MSRLDKIPTGPHYAVITQVSVHIPGDERSRTHPGHGYPASTEYHTAYEAFTDRAEWEDRIRTLTERRESFRAIQAQPAKVTTTVKVDVST